MCFQEAARAEREKGRGKVKSQDMLAGERWDTGRCQQSNGEGIARKTEGETTECSVVEQRAESLSRSELSVVPKVSSWEGI